MRDFKNIDEVVDFVNENNYWYNGNRFESFDELSKSANEHFDVCDVETHLVKNEKYFDLDSQNTLTVSFYESYVDSGVGAEDYFYGYIISGN